MSNSPVPHHEANDTVSIWHDSEGDGIDLLGGWPRTQPYALVPWVQQVHQPVLIHLGAEFAWTSPEYVNITFRVSDSLDSLVSNIDNLRADLETEPVHAASVRKLKVCGWSEGSSVETDAEKIKALDHALARAIAPLWRLETLVIDLSNTGKHHPLPETLTEVLSCSTVKELEIRGVTPPSFKSLPNSRPVSDYYAPRFQRIALDITSTDWFSYLVEDPRNIRWLLLHKADCAPLDQDTALAIQRLAAFAHNLEVLVVSSLVQLFNLDCYSAYFESAFMHRCLPSLRAVSFDLVTTGPSLQRLLRGYAYSSITHLRLVVNQNGTWIDRFSPEHIRIIADHVPQLQELILDQTNMVLPSRLPGHLDDWGSALRRLPNLRCLGLASMFVLDVHGPCEDPDDSDSSRSSSPDVAMDDYSNPPSPSPFSSNAYPDADVDMSMSPSSPRPSSSSSYSSTSSTASLTPLQHFNRNVTSLAVWAETFLDNHLRKPSLQEFWLLGVKPPCSDDGYVDSGVSEAGLGFYQVVDQVLGVEKCDCGTRCGEERVVNSVIVRKAVRSGWWWEDMGRSGLY